MASGHPDWGQSQSTGLIATVSDLGELAARLGALSVMNRAGNMIFHDDFSDGVSNWKVQTGAPGSSLVPFIGNAFSGAVSLKIISTALLNDGAEISRYMVVPFLTRIGVEGMVCFKTNNPNFRVRLLVYTGSHLNQYVLQYNPASNGLTYFTTGNVFAIIDSALVLNNVLNLYHYFKLVIDLTQVQYARVIVNQQMYDLAGALPTSAIDSTSPRIQIFLSLISNNGVALEGYLDNVIFTINEP